MEERVKKFIKQNIDVVRKGDLAELYALSAEEETGIYPLTMHLTEVLLNAGIDPLSSLGYVPDFFMNFGRDRVTSIDLPSTIKRIGSRAFFNCRPQSVKIPEGVVSIGEKAFAFCYTLETVYLPSTLTSIERGIFVRDGKLSKIFYNGTQESWEAIHKPADWISSVPAENIIILEFNDGSSIAVI